MSQKAEDGEQRGVAGPGSGLEALRQSSEFRGPGDSPHDHDHANDHFALLYDRSEEQLASAIPFIRQGLERGEQCLYVADDNSQETVLEAMRAYDIDVDAALESGALSILTPAETYRRTGEFDRETMLEFWEDSLEKAKDEEGYSGLRAAAEMTWALEGDTGPDELVEYEAVLNSLYEDEDYVVMCQYNRERFPVEVIRDVIKTHPHLVVDNTISQNFYYTPPEKFFGSDDLESKVDRMTQTLREHTTAKTELQEHRESLQELYEVTASNSLSFEEKLQAMLNLGCARFDMELGGLAIADPETDRFEVEVTNGEHENLVSGEQYPLSETYCQAAVDAEETCAITAPESDEFEGKLCYDKFGVRSYLGTYLEFDDAANRTFWFVSNDPRAGGFSESERTFHHLMGQWVQYELERQQREQELRERTEHLNALIETTPECIKTVAPDGTLLQMNSTGLDMVEADAAEDVTGECVYDLIAPEHRERFREFNERICRGESGTLEFDIVGLEGTRRHMETHAAPLERPDGTTVHVALTRDITEQKERKRELDETITELQESEERLRLALEAGEMGTWELDLQSGDAPVRSPQHDRIFGYEEPLDDWSFETFLDHVHPDDRERVKQRFEEAFETGKWDFECWITGADGEQRAISAQGEFYHDNEGEPVRAVGVVKDVTERKQAEENLQKSKEQFRALVTASSDVVYRMSPDWNEMHELEGKDFLSDTTEPTSNWVEKYILPEDQQRVMDAIDEAIRTKSVFELEHRVEQDDGSIGWTFSRAVPMLDEDGEIDEWVGMARDITERKERERELERVERQFEAAFNNPSSFMGLLDPDGTVRRINDTALEFAGIDEAEVQGEKFWETPWFTHSEDLQAEIQEGIEQAAGGEYVRAEIPHQSPDGEIAIMDAMLEPVRDEDGEVVAVVPSGHDITEQKEREAELRQTKDRFERVFEQSDDGIFIIDPEADELVDANPAAADMLGYTRDGLLSHRPSDVHPDEMEQFRAFLDETREQGSVWSEDLHCRHKNGHEIPAEITASTITLDGRDLVLTLVRSIEERKIHEQYQRDLYEITADPDLSFDEKLERLLELGRDRFGLEMGGLNHLPSWDGKFRLEKGVGLGLDPDEELWTDPDNNCYCRQTITEKDPVAMTDVRGTHWTEDTIYQEFGMVSYLGTKVSGGSVPYGTLWFGSTEPREKPFSAAERSFIELMGQWVSYEIERKEHKQSQQELYEITSDSDLSFDEKVGRLLDLGREKFGLDMGFFLEKQGDEFGVVKTRGTDLEDGVATLCANPDQYCKRTITMDVPVGVEDTEAAGWDDDPLYREYGLGCYLGTKVTDGTGVYGSVCFADSSSRNQEFSEDDFTFLDLMGQWLSYELERREREAELETTIEQLQQSNDRLKQFAYAASHDLQEPLRMVSSYLQLLENQYKNELDEDAQEYIDFAVDGADRMRAMVNDLLAFARVERADGEFESVDCNRVLDRVIEDLQVKIEENDAEISVESLPTVHADGEQLEQVFCNLISNAIKYSGEESPEVEIAVEEQADQWQFAVADNGIGIDPDKQERIFEVFKRLHHGSEYPGTGIGLSLCQEIVGNHDGDIWVDSELGEGSTFFFTIPKQVAN